MKNKLLALLITACMIFALMPAVAGASDMPVEVKSVEIKLAIGSPTLTVNGTTSTIQKPYKQNGTTMVPLSVITKAFGAGLKLENNKIITLSYNKTTVVLTIGSKSVKVNGSPITLTAEPKIVNNVTMVPLRVIVSAFGATLALNGNAITIKGFKVATTAASTGNNTGGINSDAGKTQVGDSYYNWSMKYPSDLVMTYQNDNGTITEWSSVAEDSKIAIFIEDVDQAYSHEELRDYAADYFASDEFAVEKKTVTIGNLSFEKIISKSRSGWYYEYRVIQVDNRIYMAASGVKSENKDKLNGFQDILNSFKPSFAKSDISLKDITKVQNGNLTVTDKDYGLSVKLPVDWVRVKDASFPMFANKNGLMSVQISSLKENDTAADWMHRMRQKLENSFLPDYLRNVSESSMTLADGQAQVLGFEYSYDKKVWYKEYDVFFAVAKHKYELDYLYVQDGTAKGESLFTSIASSIDIDTNFVESNFSDLDDAEHLADLTVTKTSKKYGYSIGLPESWHGVDKDFEEDSVFYTIPFGSVGIDTFEETSTSDYINMLRNFINSDDNMKKAGAVIKETTTTTVGSGISATKIVVDFPTDTVPSTTIFYIFEKNGTTYLINYTVNQSNNTDSNRAAVEKVIGSFTFTS
ncbi:stalk domain-containing protein [Paenibacillus albus]|uniref:stalk domain-containing protein n=1 Tax=Paenibacillus albus TaxID=2495582 RepID=UPI0013E02665|nr:stalk domain-containing protein [Paenibacillus albus]